MQNKIITVVGIIILFLGTCVTPTVAIDNAKRASMPISNGNTLYVGGTGEGNYSKIQDAIDNASDGDTVFVYNGVYYENLTIFKSINLFGENSDFTIIDGNKNDVDMVEVFADWVNISGFTITKGMCGIYINIYSDYHTIVGNIISNNSCGIELEGDGTTIKVNTFSNYGPGIYLYESIDNIIIDNSFYNDGIMIKGSYQNIISNNTVNDKPLIYFENEYDMVVESDAGQVILVGCDNITVQNQMIFNTTVGIELSKSKNCLLYNNTISFNNVYGIFLEDSNNITVNLNSISDNHCGIKVISKRCLIINNNISNNSFGVEIIYGDNNYVIFNSILINEFGIFLRDSNKNNITSNNISNNIRTANLFLFSNDNTISKNNFINNNDGMNLANSNNNNISKNNFVNNNDYGITIGISIRNSISYNNFINNRKNAFFRCSFMNKWNYNYWNKPLDNPKIIIGRLFGLFGLIPWFNFDWHPAKEPYDI